ncbi:MAG TPA: nitrogen fixation protein [Thiotrichales bacterium]|nr:nitrogen fixation protein [Thiotrichales bacterium]
MKIAVTSQNFRTITGHAGKTRRFIIYKADAEGNPQEVARLDLSKEMSMHAWPGGPHPIDAVDVLITAGCGDGFANKMVARDIVVIRTSEVDPLLAVRAVLDGQPLPPPAPHAH